MSDIRSYTTVVLDHDSVNKLLKVRLPEDTYLHPKQDLCILNILNTLSIHISPTDALRLGEWVTASALNALDRMESE
jgi:hypothetical protein